MSGSKEMHSSSESSWPGGDPSPSTVCKDAGLFCNCELSPPSSCALAASPSALHLNLAFPDQHQQSCRTTVGRGSLLLIVSSHSPAGV